MLRHEQGGFNNTIPATIPAARKRAAAALVGVATGSAAAEALANTARTDAVLACERAEEERSSSLKQRGGASSAEE
jgi:hypothetical protein